MKNRGEGSNTAIVAIAPATSRWTSRSRPPPWRTRCRRHPRNRRRRAS